MASSAPFWLRVQYVPGTETQRRTLHGDGAAGRVLAGLTLPPASLTGHLPPGALAAMAELQFWTVRTWGKSLKGQEAKRVSLRALGRDSS